MTDKAQRKGAWALWIGVVFMFLIIIGAWTTLITIASENPTQRIEIGASAEVLNSKPQPEAITTGQP